MPALDVVTAAVATLGVEIAFALAMSFYGRVQRNFPGFRSWTASAYMVVGAFFFLLLRPVAPGLSVVLSNLLFSTWGLTRLDGTLRFTGGSGLDRRWFLVPVLVAALCAALYFPGDHLLARVWVIAVVLSGVSTALGLVFLRHARAPGRILWRTAGMLHFLYPPILLGRAVMRLQHPQAGLFDPSGREAVFFLLICIMEVILLTLFLMMNAQLLQEELSRSREELASALEGLRASRAQVEVLSGLLPICARCKQIRDAEGRWHPVEEYVRARSDAEFSHSVCPSCVRILYPEHADLADG